MIQKLCSHIHLELGKIYKDRVRNCAMLLQKSVVKQENRSAMEIIKFFFGKLTFKRVRARKPLKFNVYS